MSAPKFDRTPREAPATISSLQDLVGQVLLEVRELRARLEQREFVGGPRDDVDGAVGKAIAELGLSRSASSNELFALASTDAECRRALAAAMIDNPPQLGKCLARLRRRGLANRDVTRGPHGWRWTL